MNVCFSKESDNVIERTRNLVSRTITLLLTVSNLFSIKLDRTRQNYHSFSYMVMMSTFEELLIRSRFFQICLIKFQIFLCRRKFEIGNKLSHHILKHATSTVCDVDRSIYSFFFLVINNIVMCSRYVLISKFGMHVLLE